MLPAKGENIVKVQVIALFLVCAGAIDGLALSPPQYGLQRKLVFSYGSSPMVDVGEVYESGDSYVIDVACASEEIAAGLSLILTREWEFGGLHTIVRVLDPSGNPVDFDESAVDVDPEEITKELLGAVLAQNPLFTGTVHEEGYFPGLTFEIMPEVIQFWNDNIGNPYGLDNFVAAAAFSEVSRSSLFADGVSVWFACGLKDSDTGGHHSGVIPVAAHAPGSFGSWWTTDVWIHYMRPGSVSLWFNPADEDNSTIPGLSVELPSGQNVLRIDDIVHGVFGELGLGSIRYQAGPRVKVFSRTWTPGPEGGSYGQNIDGVNLEKALRAASSSRSFRMLTNQSSESRVNLGLLSLSPAPMTIEINILDSSFDPLPGDSVFEVTLQPFSMTQMNDVLARLEPGERDGLIIRATAISPTGLFLAYLAEVDNMTNDSSYQEGFQ